jgi:DNA-binding NarL/FixJ family response regulator
MGRSALPMKGACRTDESGVSPIPDGGPRRYAEVVPIRLVLAEDNVLVREGVRTLLALEDDLELVGVSEDLDGLMALVEAESPDVVLTDIRMPPTGTDEGVRAAKELRLSRPDIGVVVLSHYLEPSYALALFADGAHGRGYLLKERVSDVEQLVGAIREVARGGSVVDPKVVDALMAARLAARSPIATLTRRERETLAEMAQGKNNAAIAEALVLSDRAVEKHINAVFTKLGLSAELDVHRRVKAVLVYLAEQGRLGESAV